ncbi:AmmeMemoRadiSam system protein B [Acidobacteria bacterium ACD]|nr:MAG: AmmeMemoRadiSam system protein B [Acidobacteriota bacterium]MDL1950761.1 AmmeMemoRadiSam system protein B [Acidobacteria bacterium ACD]
MRPTVRPPAVAGLFYEGEPGALRREVVGFLASAPAPRLPASRWRGLLMPHAGYEYSGPIAGAGAGAVEWPDAAVLLGPNHTGLGDAVAVSGASAWRTPLGDVPVSSELVDLLLSEVPEATVDERAHAREHSIEVELPFLQVLRPGIEVACVCLGERNLELCRSVGRGLAAAVERYEASGRRVALVVSSDMNHYLPRPENRRKDLRAIDALLAGDPAELFDRVLLRERISMCGVLPATALLEALRALGGARPRLLSHGDSGDASGDTDRVVGYASVLWTEPTEEQ